MAKSRQRTIRHGGSVITARLGENGLFVIVDSMCLFIGYHVAEMGEREIGCEMAFKRGAPQSRISFAEE